MGGFMFRQVRLLMMFMSIAFLPNVSYSQNPLLKELAQEDQASRSGNEITRTDADRIKLVLGLIAQDALKVPEDKFNAALVLQHTGFTFCDKRLVSQSPDNYLLAHHLFKSAYEAGQIGRA